MNRAKGLKEKIIGLRNSGMSYNAIANDLKCSKATVCYHCQNVGLTNIGLCLTKLNNEDIEKVKEFYLINSLSDTANFFNISKTTVKKYATKGRIPLSIIEKKTKNYQRVKSRRQKIKIKAIEYKGGKCEKCGYSKCGWSLDFHHTNPEEKDFSIAKNSTLSWDKVRKELDKCIMVCANCHREIHYEEYLKNN